MFLPQVTYSATADINANAVQSRPFPDPHQGAALPLPLRIRSGKVSSWLPVLQLLLAMPRQFLISAWS